MHLRDENVILATLRIVLMFGVRATHRPVSAAIVIRSMKVHAVGSLDAHIGE
jgi:hypothetical protein